jgi:hypothetical protein
MSKEGVLKTPREKRKEFLIYPQKIWRSLFGPYRDGSDLILGGSIMEPDDI